MFKRFRSPWSNKDLKSKDLASADGPGSNLYKCDFTDANLWGADPGRANMEKCILMDANMTRAKMTRTNLDRAESGGVWLEYISRI